MSHFEAAIIALNVASAALLLAGFCALIRLAVALAGKEKR